MSLHYKGKIVQWKWFDEECISSTNDAVKNCQQQDFPVVISAKQQTAGRGRRGRQWIAGEGNLYFTFSLTIPTAQISTYVCLIGLSLAKTVQQLDPTAKIKIKWPNDIFLNDKKLTGILLENIAADQWAVGIGVNIMVAPKLHESAYQATSLKSNNIITTRENFLHQYLEVLSQDLRDYQRNGFSNLKEQWLALAMGIGEEITIKNERVKQKGVFLTLDDRGYLILKTEHGQEKIIAGDLFL
ncbi:MAG: biotin--[Alphaproteobacteria bacterium]|nr:biotin--[acetyl-CoA-carboxylase] ligase [Alphaproteobacteria bacterium]